MASAHPSFRVVCLFVNSINLGGIWGKRVLQTAKITLVGAEDRMVRSAFKSQRGLYLNTLFPAAR